MDKIITDKGKGPAVPPKKEDFEYLQSAPPGFRFCPQDHELINYYLHNKLKNKPLPKNKIVDVNIYEYEPEELTEKFKDYGDNEKEWYFFTPRDRKYPNGYRPDRAALNGFWKATVADQDIVNNRITIGWRKHLVFHRGNSGKGSKTDWIMHEFRTTMDTSRKPSGPQNMKLDDWVLCRIYNKTDKPIRVRIGNCSDVVKDVVELQDVEHEHQHQAPPTPAQKKSTKLAPPQFNHMSSTLVPAQTTMADGFLSSSVNEGTYNNPQQAISHGGHFQNPINKYYHQLGNHGMSASGFVSPAHVNSQPIRSSFNNTLRVADDVNQDLTRYFNECYDECQPLNILDIFTGEVPPYDTGLYYFEETTPPPTSVTNPR